VVLSDILRKLASTLQSTDVSFYYLRSCLSIRKTISSITLAGDELYNEIINGIL
jgi:hypothetical protein